MFEEKTVVKISSSQAKLQTSVKGKTVSPQDLKNVWHTFLNSRDKPSVPGPASICMFGLMNSVKEAGKCELRRSFSGSFWELEQEPRKQLHVCPVFLFTGLA